MAPRIASIVFLAEDAAADSQQKLVIASGCVALMSLACCAYGANRWPRLPRLLALGALSLGSAAVPPIVLSLHGGPLRSYMAHFSLAYFGVLGFFRMLEVLCGTGPKGFDKRLSNLVLYMAAPAEVLFDKEGNFEAASWDHVARRVLDCAGYSFALAVLNGIGIATAFRPFLDERADPMSMRFFGFPSTLPALYLQAAWAYCMLANGMSMGRFVFALVGINTLEPMRAPLLRSSSVRDFWGRRWNLLIHGLMKRTFFKPFAVSSSNAMRTLGSLMAFLMSGLFHEYMWMLVNWHQPDYKGGRVLLFFLLQVVLCTFEASLSRTTLGQWAAHLPAVTKTAFTTVAILPFGPLFFQGLLRSGMMQDAAYRDKAVKLLPASDPMAEIGPFAGTAAQGVQDWGLICLLSVVAIGYISRGSRKLIRSREGACTRIAVACEP